MWGSHHWVQPIPNVGYARLRESGAELAVRMNFVRHVTFSANAFLDQPFEIVQILVDPTRNGAAEARGQF